jgi:hypothetical protein
MLWPYNFPQLVCRVGAVAVALGMTWISVPSAGASAPAPGFSLAVSPTRLLVSAQDLLEPQTLTVTDKGNQPLDVVMSKIGFTELPDGSPKFERDAPYSAVNWVTVDPGSFHLDPGEHRQVTVTIDPPGNAEPGEHQVALVSSVLAPKSGSNIRINRGIGVALYVTVPGPIDRSTTTTGLQAPGFALGGPVTLTATFRDTGTVHRDFTGDGRLNIGVYGGKVALPDFTVLRGTTRVVSAQWAHPPFMCICHATVLLPNAAGRIIRTSTTIVIFPIHLVALSVAALGLLFLAWRLTRRRFHALVTAEVNRYGDD